MRVYYVNKLLQIFVAILVVLIFCKQRQLCQVDIFRNCSSGSVPTTTTTKPEESLSTNDPLSTTDTEVTAILKTSDDHNDDDVIHDDVSVPTPEEVEELTRLRRYAQQHRTEDEVAVKLGGPGDNLDDVIVPKKKVERSLPDEVPVGLGSAGAGGGGSSSVKKNRKPYKSSKRDNVYVGEEIVIEKNAKVHDVTTEDVKNDVTPEAIKSDIISDSVKTDVTVEMIKNDIITEVAKNEVTVHDVIEDSVTTADVIINDVNKDAKVTSSAIVEKVRVEFSSVKKSPEEVVEIQLNDNSTEVTSSNSTSSEEGSEELMTSSEVKEVKEKNRHDLSVSTLLCVTMSSAEVLGYGDEHVHDMMKPLILPFILVTLVVFFNLINVVQFFSTLEETSSFQSMIVSILHGLLWGSTACLLFFFRNSWNLKWAQENINPEYPYQWYIAEMTCILMVIYMALEVYFNDLMHYNIYVEKSYGVYQVVEPANYQCSIYRHDGIMEQSV